MKYLTRVFLIAVAIAAIPAASANDDDIYNRYIDLAKTDVMYYQMMERGTREFTMYASKPLGPEEQDFLREQSAPATIRPYLIDNMKRRKVKTEDLEYEIQMLESDIGPAYMDIVENCKCFSVELMPEGIQAAGIAEKKFKAGELSEDHYTRLSEFLLSKQHARFYFDHRSSILGSGSKRRKVINKGLKKIRKALSKRANAHADVTRHGLPPDVTAVKRVAFLCCFRAACDRFTSFRREETSQTIRAGSNAAKDCFTFKPVTQAHEVFGAGVHSYKRGDRSRFFRAQPNGGNGRTDDWDKILSKPELSQLSNSKGHNNERVRSTRRFDHPFHQSV